MRVGIYTGGSHPVANALKQGFSSAGCRVAARASGYHRGEIEPLDLVVAYGMRAGRKVRDAYRAAGVPVVIVDWGYLARVNTRDEYEAGHFQVGLERLNAAPEVACPADRFDALGLELVERGGDPTGYVLVCGQVPSDAAHGLGKEGYMAWLRNTLQQYPDAVYRPHPRGGIDLPGVESDRRPLTESLTGARLIVTYNSNVGHEALLAGVPVIAESSAAYAELVGESLPSIEVRRDYFHRLAYGQWTLAEMRSGECQRFILDHLLTGVGPAVEGVRPDDSEPGEQVAGIDLAVQPADTVELADGLDEMTAAELRALAKERGLKLHPRTGAEKLREALREAE